MAFPSFTQDPNARLDYEVDWSEWLPDGDTLLTSTWTPGDPAIVCDGGTTDATSARIFVSFNNPTIGQRYIATNHIETVQGRVNDQTIRIKVKSL